MKDNILNSILIAAAFSALVLIAIGEAPGDAAPVSAAAQSPRVTAPDKAVASAESRADGVILVAATGR